MVESRLRLELGRDMAKPSAKSFAPQGQPGTSLSHTIAGPKTRAAAHGGPLPGEEGGQRLP